MESRYAVTHLVDLIEAHPQVVLVLVIRVHVLVVSLRPLLVVLDLLVQLLLTFAQGLSSLKVVELLQSLFRYIDLFLLI